MPDAARRMAAAYELIEAARVIDGSSPSPLVARLQQLCTALAGELLAWGVGVSVFSVDQLIGFAVASGPAAQELEELQFSLAQGPCIDAFSCGRPILEPELARRGTPRWPVYAPAAQQRGIGAVFAFPVQVGAARLGSLDIYCHHAGSLSTGAVSQAVTFAEVAMQIILDAQNATTPSSDGLDDVLGRRVEVYQAQGMVMVDLGVPLAEAMARMRGYAYASDRPLSDVARDIVVGRLTLERDSA